MALSCCATGSKARDLIRASSAPSLQAAGAAGACHFRHGMAWRWKMIEILKAKQIRDI